ncbi:MAG: ferritin-like domain-containing protein [Actinomycetota bacterium]
MTVRRCDAGELELGGGLETLLQASLQRVEVGHELEVATASRETALQLPGWARVAGHQVVDEKVEGNVPRRAYVVRVRRGPSTRILAGDLVDRDAGLPLRTGSELHTADLRRRVPLPDRVEGGRGLSPIGAEREEGAPPFDWQLNERDRMWTDEIADLAERASAAQWDASVDIPWEAAKDLPDDIERAVAQVMTYVAQNEYAALYVPSYFLRRVNPAYVEVLLWLASHVHDEARHVEVFTKRSLVGGYNGYALASTELSLHTLLEERDFSAAALLLNVLGEGTFLDLLRFIERHAPDRATATAARLAHRDELRHVRFGIAHVRRVVGLDPDKRRELSAAVEGRAAKLVSLSGLSPVIGESLTVMAAGSLNVSDLSEGAAAVKGLMRQMDANRIKRLRAAGFDEGQARHLSDLHTPNLM